MEKLQKLLFGKIHPDKGGNIRIIEAFVDETSAEVILHCQDKQEDVGYSGSVYEKETTNLTIWFSDKLDWNYLDYHEDENYQTGWNILYNKQNLAEAYEYAIGNLPTWEEYNKAKIKKEMLEICRNVLKQEGIEKLKEFLIETGEDLSIIEEIL